MLAHLDPEGGLTLALARGLSVTALLSVFGTLAFRTVVAPRVFERMPADATRRIKAALLRLAWLGLAAELLATLAWLVLQSADMAGAASVGAALSAVPVVLRTTSFGHLVAVQLALPLVVALAIGRRDRRRRMQAACGLAGLATALQAGHSHAASMYPGTSVLLASDVVHLLAAGAWLGGLVPLLLVVALSAPREGATAARWFSPLGKLCLVAVAASALVQGWVLVASIPGLVGTGYGWMALLKTALFGVLLAFAVLNRYRLAPALLRGDPRAGRRVLVASIAVQTGFGVAILVAASVLSSLAPAMHEQPVWPFPVRLTLATLEEDPAFAREAVAAGLALAGAAALLVAAVFVRRALRWSGVAAAIAITWLAVPHLDLLLVPATPTSFYRSPTGFAADAIVRGAALYPGQCAACHGADGRGDGLAGRGLARDDLARDDLAGKSLAPPADLTAAHLWMHGDGELFWWLSHGIEAPDGGLAMPGFAPPLSQDQVWSLIDYVRAHNAGLVVRSTGAWQPPLQAPGFQLRCQDDRVRSLADLQGRFVRLVIGTAPGAPDPAAVTVLATADPAARPAPGLCVADDGTLPAAYGIVSGLAPQSLAGVQVLIDGQGWLRALQPADASPGWNDARRLDATIRQMQAHPVAGASENDHAHTQM